MKSREFAIVDIETTGGSAANGRMTEIAILIHDGEKVLERYESLIDPEMEIPYYITGLTGISHETLTEAPAFCEIAKKVYDLLKNRIFVAHNVNFDYSFIRKQLKEEGFQWKATRLCTVRLSRKIKPGLTSYSLGNLCNSLEIPLVNRHRAMGDAKATALLFSRLIKWDRKGHIEKMLNQNSSEQNLPPHLPVEEFYGLPSKPGVYYFIGRTGKMLYIGKAVNLKKRVASHFTGNKISLKKQELLKKIHHISYQVCGTELIALLTECLEIKHYWPPYNRSLKKYEPQFGLAVYEDLEGYKRIAVSKNNHRIRLSKLFYTKKDAMNYLLDLIENKGLDIRFCNFGQRKYAEEFNSTKALQQLPLPEKNEYNLLVDRLLNNENRNSENFIILDNGFNENQFSCIYVENGQLYGIGYLDNDLEIKDYKQLKNLINPCKSNHYMMHLITSFAERFPEKVRTIKE